MDSYNNLWSPEQVEELDRFSHHNHIRVVEADKQGAYGVLEVCQDALNPHGMVHGGCLAALADTVAGWGVLCATGRGCVTANYGFNFLRPAHGTNKKIHCHATPEKVGKTLCVSRVTLTDDAGKVVATGDFTFFLLDIEGSMVKRAE